MYVIYVSRSFGAKSMLQIVLNITQKLRGGGVLNVLQTGVCLHKIKYLIWHDGWPLLEFASYRNWLEEGFSLETSIVTQVAKGHVTSRCDLVSAI